MTNNGCERYCEVMNRPAYIVLFKGDDSDFEGNQSVDIVIDTELDTTGMKAHFRFMDFVQDFDSIPENKTLSLVFPNAKTSEFPLGAADATLRFEDSSGKFRTISNRIHIVVTNSVNEAYDNEDSQSITVTVKGTVTWDMIEGKPPIPAPIIIDPALSTTSENPVQNKVVSKALYTGFTEWQFSGDTQSGHTYSVVLAGGYAYLYDGNTEISHLADPDSDTEIDFDLGMPAVDILATRHLITPTKTSQLTNDSGFLTQHQDISGKLDGAAAYPAWEDEHLYSQGDIITYKGRIFQAISETIGEPPEGAYLSLWNEVLLADLKQDALSSAQIGYINDVPNKADKVSGATAGNLATLNAQGNLADSGVKPSDFAAKADLPYAMVTPGEWEFSGVPSGYSDPVCEWDSSQSAMTLTMQYNGDDFEIANYDVPQDSLSVTFAWDEGPGTETHRVTATRPSLPGHLLDRAGNLVEVSGDTTLTLPALANAGRLRDFLVRLEISGSTVPTITFAAPTGETITYETDGDEFPVPDEAGTWLYSFTETAAGVFAVALKSVSVVTQGGV